MNDELKPEVEARLEEQSKKSIERTVAYEKHLDHFAAAALQGILSTPNPKVGERFPDIAKYAFDMAEAMVEEHLRRFKIPR